MLTAATGWPHGPADQQGRRRRPDWQERQKTEDLEGVELITAQCADRPGAFESFCADLFRAHGYHVAVTPPSRDSGISLRLLRNRSISVVRCVCCQPRQAVGLPLVQGLYEASAHERTDTVVMVTTGSFTEEATAFAQRTGTRLIDGEQLVAMCQEVWGCLPATTIPLATIDLTREETLTRSRPALQIA